MNTFWKHFYKVWKETSGSKSS